MFLPFLFLLSCSLPFSSPHLMFFLVLEILTKPVKSENSNNNKDYFLYFLNVRDYHTVFCLFFGHVISKQIDFLWRGRVIKHIQIVITPGSSFCFRHY
jgi:hypothetical protein